MQRLKIILFILTLPLMSFSLWHKYYVSVSEIEYVKDKKSVQIISRYFIDDFEKALRMRYDEKLALVISNESESVDFYIEKYFNQKFEIQINGNPQQYIFLGKEYEDDMILCYLELENINEINSIEVASSMLQDVFPEQQNIIKLKVNGKNKSFLLNKENPKGLLKF